jgi:N-acyl-L-homoserine lactone synthetase
MSDPWPGGPGGWPSARRSSNPLLAEEGSLRVELLRSGAERTQAFRLRHQLFAEDLRWVPEAPSGLEVDAYDPCTEMLAVLDPLRRVLGQVRVHDASAPFMLEHEFREVLGAGPVPRKARDAAELTRFGVRPDSRALKVTTAFGCFDLFTLLFKGVYRWSRAHGVRTLYGVTDRRVLRLLHLRGFPFETLAEPKPMPDGVIALAVRLEWSEFERQNRVQRPGLLAWFHRGLAKAGASALRGVPAVPASGRWRRLAAGSPHPA